MGWPPQIGEPLPRAEDGWCSREKWVEWILAEDGHGPEWAKVLHVGDDQWELAWHTLKEAVAGARIETVRPRQDGEFSCGVSVELSIAGRTAIVVSAWHYSEPDAAPRLVTAYPTAYN